MTIDTPSISLSEFISEAKNELDRFERIWINSATSDPQNWPMSMPAGEWEEQFIAHLHTFSSKD